MHLKKIIFLRTAGLLTFMALMICCLSIYFALDRHRNLTIQTWKARSEILAEAVQRLILWDDRVALKEMLESEVHKSTILKYALITKDGEPYISTLSKGIPTALLEKFSTPEQPSLWEFQDNNGAVIYNITEKIGPSKTFLHLGISQQAIDRKILPLITLIAAVCLIAIAAGISMSFMLAGRTTKEVDTLVDALRLYGGLNGMTDLAVTPKSSEVEELVTAFKMLTSKRKQAEQELMELNLQLEQRVEERTKQLATANRELDAFAYSVSHDLRAPLRGINGFSLALMNDYGDILDAEAKEFLGRIRKGCVRMGGLIDEMLKLSRITRSEINRVPLNLSDMAKQIADELTRAEPERSTEFVIYEVPEVNADAELVHTVLENLIGNAWKYSSKVKNARIEFGAIKKDETIYYVNDNGAGFNMEYSSKLFEPFQRLHREDEFEGTGLGLASVQRIVLRHGGRIWAEGEIGKGASFYFSLAPT